MPIEIVSIDEMVLNDVEIASGGRTLQGDFELVPRDGGATLRKMSLSAEGTTVTGSGELTSLAGPAGEIAIGPLMSGRSVARPVNEFAFAAGILPGNAPTFPASSVTGFPPCDCSMNESCHPSLN